MKLKYINRFSTKSAAKDAQRRMKLNNVQYVRVIPRQKNNKMMYEVYAGGRNSSMY